MGCWRDWMLLKRSGLCYPVCQAFLYLYPALHSAVPTALRGVHVRPRKTSSFPLQLAPQPSVHSQSSAC